MPAHSSTPAPSSTSESASDVIRWAAFSCALVPVVLLVYGTSFGGAAGTALGLAAVTAVCRVLLRRSERIAEKSRHRTAPHRGRHSRTGTGAHRGGRHGAGARPETDTFAHTRP
ncbi:hypothetical protein QWM81_06935 [Streptomyces ficellus]|uniref:Uncharacterized protein n=1 Tax=Streptomyces ficellus TaxID=1977088 RepID=A0ABT7Z2Q6_9ACTN|nr:hypothetical protein [Streptomyces ficellus]MDN3293779.1 hypothetical protein [Streptomyces ficellus]